MGDYICLECGKVLGQVMLDGSSEKEKKKKLSCPPNVPSAILYNICQNMCICDSVARYILKKFRVILKARARSVRKEVLMAYAIHDTLQRLKLSERVRDIEKFTGVSRKYFYRIDECQNTLVEINNSTASLDIFCSALELPYEATKDIAQCASKLMAEYHNSTNCILATSIFIYCAEHKLEKTLKMICNTCDVSTETVRRFRKDLLPQDVK